MEYKLVAIGEPEIEDERTVKQIFSVAGNVDAYGDIIKAGAFGKTIKERLPAGQIKVLWNHNMYEPPIGVPLVLKELKKADLPSEITSVEPNATGALYGEVRYLDTPRGNEILAGIKAKAITQNSIGYDAVKVRFDEIEAEDEQGNTIKRQVRVLEEIRLWDVSPVTFGANDKTVNLKRWELMREDYRLAQLADLVTELTDIDLKAGRVLSSANLSKLKAALATLSDILLAAEPSDEDASKTLTEQHVRALMQRVAIAEREFALYA